MMQETLLRVFVVALGLLMCPRDDPGVEEWDDIANKGMRTHEERLLRGEEKLDQGTPPVSEKIHTDNNETEDDRNIPNQQKSWDQNAIEKDELSEATVTSQDSEGHGADHKLPWGHSTAKSDPSLSQTYISEPDAVLKASQDAHELKGKDVHTDTSFGDPGRPQGQHEKLEKERSSKGEEIPLPHAKTSENETSEESVAEWERDYLWYIWNTFSVISMIRFCWKCLKRNSQMTQAAASPVTCTADEVQLPDTGTLQHFYAKYLQESSEKKWRKNEFVEGFANDLLEAMKAVCDKNGSVVIEDFHMLNACDIIVPFTPREPFSFHSQLWNNKGSDFSDMSVCGQIKLVEKEKIQNCPCQISDAGDDMVCLLHCENEKGRTEITDVRGLLCLKNTPFLSKSLVSRWFQSTIKQAWGLISHKYEFELNIHYIDAPGALVIRFKSGKKISFSMNPVVIFNNDAHFFITPWSSSDLDTFWTLSLTSYEDHLLDHLSKRLPENACHIQALEIARFLHKRQTALTGSSALKDFHFKTALMHLLMTKDPRHWNPDCVDSRLRDLLSFIERSLEKKELKHILVGNPLTEVIELPAELIRAKPVNLFHPLVVHNCMHRNTTVHFQEMLRNAYMLIEDYVTKCTERAN
ncbi:inositol 1,4,5-trisphosphate receptor-interacting protein [Archocentrus centrarchus]|uniref:inositol 1,4,5-trisphosphate receptor-interacting protein n=1 Tax=Archocentrus centrarchus TaxID=63155 RepID=UPI0011EA1CE4|nr:inositol 1,4,5-trisphosphate receptor-interacting protein-like [Archocentrus centrarchus]